MYTKYIYIKYIYAKYIYNSDINKVYNSDNIKVLVIA